jgi:hypothetical protein
VRPGTYPVWSANRPRRPRRVVGTIARGSGGGDGAAGRRLGGQAERREEPPHGGGVGPRAEDPPRAPTALTDQDLDREHAAEESGPGPSSRGSPAGVRARAVRLATG